MQLRLCKLRAREGFTDAEMRELKEAFRMQQPLGLTSRKPEQLSLAALKSCGVDIGRSST